MPIENLKSFSMVLIVNDWWSKKFKHYLLNLDYIKIVFIHFITFNLRMIFNLQDLKLLEKN